MTDKIHAGQVRQFHSVAVAQARRVNGAPGGPRVADNRPNAAEQRTFINQVQQSPRVCSLDAVGQAVAGSAPMVAQRRLQAQVDSSPAQRKAARSTPGGLPDHLKAGIESLSGMDMSDVRVHRNSSKPAQLNALAYAQGNDIHLGAGQEKHLPHEAWHVVQQRQGRVKPTAQLAGQHINDDAGLEAEATRMGNKALQMKADESGVDDPRPSPPPARAPVQRVPELRAGAELETHSINMSVEFGAEPDHQLLESLKGAIWTDFQTNESIQERGAGWNLTSDLSTVRELSEDRYVVDMNLEVIIGYGNDGLKTTGEFQTAVDEVHNNLNLLTKVDFKPRARLLKTHNPDRGHEVNEDAGAWEGPVNVTGRVQDANWLIHLTVGVPLGSVRAVAEHKAEHGNAIGSKRAEYRPNLPSVYELAQKGKPLESLAPALTDHQEVKPMVDVLDGLIYVFGQYLKSAENCMPDQGPKHGMSMMPRTDFESVLRIAATLLQQLAEPHKEANDIEETYQGLLGMMTAIAAKFAGGDKAFKWTNPEQEEQAIELTVDEWLDRLESHQDLVAHCEEIARHKQVGGLGRIANPVEFDQKRGFPSAEAAPIFEYRREGATGTRGIKPTLLKIIQEVIDNADTHRQ